VRVILAGREEFAIKWFDSFWPQLSAPLSASLAIFPLRLPLAPPFRYCQRGGCRADGQRCNGSFIQPFIAETAPGTVSFGQRCYYNEQCSHGTCYEPADAWCSLLHARMHG
jgi:hypothetical protein